MAMYKTSDERHLFNHKLRDQSRTIPIVEANPTKVNCRRRIEDILEQRRLQSDFEL
ncbi:PA3496 family putative envelope integrity protein [Vibrio parahaemolyticus]|uniref:PA3496 family putative envelope integrity protein n=1 Tax=Vibrio parahaemolyticus TaxID=670 RepID=UPI0025526DB8|nr:hypothetical protein [Vibrio parahaemolyticus]